MFSQTTEYALRAVVWLAGHTEQPQTSTRIASETQVPTGYLSKVLQTLGRAGLVQAQRGPRGGFTLARPPEEMTILEVINAVDPMQRITRCPLDLDEHAENLCSLHQRLDDAVAQVERVLSGTTVAELAPSLAMRDGDR